MITLKRLNVVRLVDTEEKAAKLEKKGFTRIKGEAETPVVEINAGLALDLDKMKEDILDHVSQRVVEQIKAVLPDDGKDPPKAASPTREENPSKGSKGKGAKGANDGKGADQPHSGNGEK